MGGIAVATIKGTKGNDTRNGTSGADTITGLAGNDILNGLGGNDVINGGGDDDIITGGAGRDTLTGGSGADTFKYEALTDSPPGLGADLIKDFKAAQGDKVNLTELGTATLQSSYNASFTGLQAVFVYSASTNQTTLSSYN